jgi:holliday junction DNA helicase RuvA
MIGYLSGLVKYVENHDVILDVNGVGYELQCSSNTLADLALGENSALWVHTHVREDAFTLFGFSSQVEKKLFESLLKVNGVGPKMAIVILSGATLDHIIDSIESKNVPALCALPKVGKKTAEQMILTLKGKLVVDREATPAGGGGDIVSALSNLGFKPGNIHEVVKKLEPGLSFEEKIRQALAELGGR